MPDAGPLFVRAARIRSFERDDGPRREPARDADALLVIDGRVAAVGPADAVGVPSNARVLDLHGATITPGFTDAHIHITEWALARREVDLTATTSPEEAALAVGRHPRPGHGWIRGRGWSTGRWGGAQPHRALLDRVVPDRPVALQSHDMHAVWVNSAALERAGIDAGTADPPGGSIGRDETGRPTGLLLETAGELIARHIPAPTAAGMLDAVLAAQAELHRLGITGVHSLPGILVPEPDPLSILETLRARDELRLRVLQHLPLRCLDDAVRLGLRSGFGGDWIRIGAIKFFLDGTLGSRTAWMRRPYETTAGCGIRVIPSDEFRDGVRRAAAAGLASAVHAIGDAAVALAAEVLSDRAHQVPALPHRIEHVQCLPGEGAGGGPASRSVLDAIASSGIVCSVQPAHLITDWRAADAHWGADRARQTYAFRSMLDARAVLAFGSDAPVEPADPRLGLFAATRRTDLAGEPDAGWHGEQRIALADALRAYTTGPASAAGRAGVEGRLTPGALADFVAWSADPLDADTDPLRLRAVATVVGGVLVHG